MQKLMGTGQSFVSWSNFQPLFWSWKKFKVKKDFQPFFTEQEAHGRTWFQTPLPQKFRDYSEYHEYNTFSLKLVSQKQISVTMSNNLLSKGFGTITKLSP